MDCDKFKNKYRIDSARAKWHDYDGGFYFITICTKNRECFFGTIKNSEMIFSEIGEYTQQQISKFHEHNSYSEILSSVIMPNHIHMILDIDNTKLPYKKRDIPIIIPNQNDVISINDTFQETFHETSLRTEHATETQSWLSIVIRLFKQSVTRFANQNKIVFAWQARFHDHIIRNQNEMDKITEYIENNVKKWDDDCFYINS
ncbi:transposase [bacterium]|nr:transposase [bacterium]